MPVDFAQSDFTQSNFAQSDFAQGDFAQGDFELRNFAQCDFAQRHFAQRTYPQRTSPFLVSLCFLVLVSPLAVSSAKGPILKPLAEGPPPLKQRTLSPLLLDSYYSLREGGTRFLITERAVSPPRNSL